jgi:hypothetical protein
MGVAAVALVLAAIGIVTFLTVRPANAPPKAPLPSKGTEPHSEAASPAPAAASPTLDTRMGEWAEAYRSSAGALATFVRAIASEADKGGTADCASFQNAVLSARAGIPVAADTDIQRFVTLGLNDAETAAKRCVAGEAVAAKVEAKLAGSCFHIAERLLKMRYHRTTVLNWPDVVATPSTDAVTTLSAPAPMAAEPSAPDYGAAEQTIRSHCTKEWPTDYQMQAYCTDQQHKALAVLLSGRPADVPEVEFSRMRGHCASEWPDDFQMRAYCEKQQADGYRKIN